MNWFNIKVDDLMSSEVYMGSEPVERATWLNLMMLCCLRENSGVISECSDWGDRKWMTMCGVTKDEVRKGENLYAFDGVDMKVWGYDMESQKRVELSRVNGKKGGRPPKNDKLNNPTLNPTLSTPLTQTEPPPNLNSKDKGKDKDKVSQKEAPARQEFPTLETILKFAKSQPMIIQPDCAETYFNDMEACEWVDKFNRPIKNWQASLRAYASRWNQFSQSSTNKSTPKHHKTEYVKSL